jgi:DNA (cytosine-5)-methyltransferase 1
MRSLELFSGAGGLALGLEKAGFEPAALVERNKSACATIRHNRPHWNVLSDDVRNIRFGQLGPVELVAGGPPCQPFSMGGKANGHEDHRDMFPQAVRAVRELQPLAFVFENVRGLLRPGFRNYVEYIRLQLTYPDFPISANVDWTKNFQRLERHHTSRSSDQGLRYKVTVNLANAANFGVPQHRHRVFFIGFRTDLNARWFFPTENHGGNDLLYDQYVTGNYWERHALSKPSAVPHPLKARVKDLQRGLLPTANPWRTVRDAITGLGDPRNRSDWFNHNFQGGARSYPGHTGSPLDEPSKALKAGDHGVPGGENMLRHSNGKVRYFSIREAARIQTFPDDFEFPCSWTESMRQLGNAVPVSLASTVAASVAKSLQEHVRIEAVQSHRDS